MYMDAMALNKVVLMYFKSWKVFIYLIIKCLREKKMHI
jgi:hypothetical protein